ANSWAWAAGKQFTLVIRDLGQVTNLTNVVVSATADSKGRVTFHIEASPTDVNNYTNWTVALLVNWHGYYFLLFENWYRGATFAQVVANLTGYYYTEFPNGTVVAKYLTKEKPYNPTLAPPAYTGTDALNYGYNGTWGVFTQVNGTMQFANFTSAALHQFYLAVATANQPYNLTLSETLSIAGAPVYTWTYKPLKRGWANGTVFGPITYLGTYVKSLGGAGQNVSSFLSPSSVSYSFAVKLWFPYEGSYVSQTVITSTNGIFTTTLPYNAAPNSTKFYVIKTLNYTRGYYYTPADSVNATCQQLVIWALPLSTLNVTGLFDIKGNPVNGSQYFVFKVQENIGGYPLTISQQRGVPVTLAWISGMLSLKDNTATLSSLNLSPRLVVEYMYESAEGYIEATVLQAPLNATAPVNFAANLTVSMLPVQILLWWRNGQPLPNGQPFNKPDLASALTFIFSGPTAYLVQKGRDAVVEMFGMVSWVLPPYGYPLPQSLGAPLAYLPKYNASGYLPLPTLNAFGVYL
ncbi:MAG: hypothetical protein JZD41_06610, partial [Thermoproteus sp.]|nr:hypothetical protein [Thermoproteus sp.]